MLVKKPIEILKLSTSGKVIARFGRAGQGPGEFVNYQMIRAFKNNIAIIDETLRKIAIYNKNGKYVDEFKLNHGYYGFIVSNNNHFICYGSSSMDHYFHEYSASGKYLGNFGKKVETLSHRYSQDTVRHACFVSFKNLVWTCFKTRYDLRCYKNRKAIIEIKERKNYIKCEEMAMQGRKVRIPLDFTLDIVYNDDKLYFFCLKKEEKIVYCDIINLTNNTLQKRVKLKPELSDCCG